MITNDWDPYDWLTTISVTQQNHTASLAAVASAHNQQQAHIVQLQQQLDQLTVQANGMLLMINQLNLNISKDQSRD